MAIESLPKDKLDAFLDAYSIGCTVEEAEIDAGITHTQYLDHCAANAEFLQELKVIELRPRIAKKRMIANSKRVIEEKCKTESKEAQWVLERIDPEFSPKSKNEHSGPGGSPLPQAVVNLTITDKRAMELKDRFEEELKKEIMG